MKDRGYKVEAPNINDSSVGFIIKDKSIIFGLSGIKGVGASVSNKILKRRPKNGYKSFGHFLMRNIDILNKKIIESYSKAGAFSVFGINKNTVLGSVDGILDFISMQKDLASHYSIFDLLKIDVEAYINLHKMYPSKQPDDLHYEIETLGLYITKHPMEDYVINDNNGISIDKICNMVDGEKVITAGALSSIDVRKTKAKVNMASFDLTNETNSVKCLVFPKVYSKEYTKLEEGKIVVLVGFLKEEDDSRFIIVNKIVDDPIEMAKILCKTEKRNTEYDGIKWHIGVNTIKEEVAGLIVNKNLSFILRRQ